MKRISVDHAEGRSKPIAPDGPAPEREAQPRGARLRGNRPVDHAEAAERFLAAPDHLSFHDKRLWDLREKRDRESHGIAEWEELRALASAIKEHALTRLDDYLEQFERNAVANGITVHWARDAAEHNRIVSDILRVHGATLLVKSKSMLTEECGMRPHLEAQGIAVIETDLGERIQQLDDEDPSHVVVPAVHKLRSDVAAVFARTLGSDADNDDPAYLAEQQREANRPLILDAKVGMTGANFLVAETGAVVVCTNEGNADLCAGVPEVHIVSAGIEKIIPRAADLGVFIRLLSRSALGSPITQYTSHFRGPRAGGSMHVVLVDNGRTARLGMEEFWTSLKCIRCGACMNTCPVYRRSGGLAQIGGGSCVIGILFAVEFDRRHSTRDVRATAVHPGAVLTGTTRKMIEAQPAAASAHTWKTVAQGAATSVFAGFVAAVDEVGAQYCEDCRIADVIDDAAARFGVRSYALDPGHAKALWRKSEEMVGEGFGPAPA